MPDGPTKCRGEPGIFLRLSNRAWPVSHPFPGVVCQGPLQAKGPFFGASSSCRTHVSFIPSPPAILGAVDFTFQVQLLLVLCNITTAMEDYEMKNGTAASAYDVDAERVVNPTEDNDLVQIGYKPELEVPKMRHPVAPQTIADPV